MTTQPNTTNLDDLSCAQCGFLDIRVYDGEHPRCPHCGAVLDTPPPEPVSWLSQWPANRRSILAQLFYTAVRRGATATPAIVEQVAAEIHQRLQWTSDPDKRQLWGQVLNTLSDDPKAAQEYAVTVLATEQLPVAVRMQQKQEKAKPYVLEAMRGKPATDKQHWLLRSKGYAGPLPTDRAEASELIDSLLRRMGGIR